MKKALLSILLLLASCKAFAGRPMATDDAGTVGDKQCQLETWRERATDANGWVIAPACGLGAFELGLEASATHLSKTQKEWAQTLALKWAPEFLQFGPLSLGAKAWTGRAKLSPPTEDEWQGYRPVENGGLLLASWDIGAGFTAHLNLGSQLDRVESKYARTSKLALSFEPHQRVLIFAEALGVQNGGVTQSAGLRLWAIPEKLGIDFTASRVAGVQDSNAFSLGFGWHGIFGE